MTKKIKFVLDIDDIHPQRGYGYKDEYYNRLKELLKLGVRPTYFIVPKWWDNDKFDITHHKEWIKSLGDGEFQSHGLTHLCSIPVAKNDSHLEFLKLSNDAASKHVAMSSKLIESVTGIAPSIIRFPGWFATPEQAEKILKDNKNIKAIADHFVGTKPRKMYNMLNFPITCNLGEEFNSDDLIVCHAHISEGYNGRNENALNEKNFQLLKSFIKKNKDNLTFCTMSEVFL